ncbi:hypothetical protein C4D60_Mb04t32720 [Musa balbisiana]|uniref:Uncharacterized protein n=1 Tax=Musa balbisiana TaxID=52838 RepID=A0A4S8KGH7_MUSBA|nr:hypothetical protein C4D60_Mb04t32720 [Musa balbisiana]
MNQVDGGPVTSTTTRYSIKEMRLGPKEEEELGRVCYYKEQVVAYNLPMPITQSVSGFRLELSLALSLANYKSSWLLR